MNMLERNSSNTDSGETSVRIFVNSLTVVPDLTHCFLTFRA